MNDHEHRIECAVERKMDAIDRAFMDGRIATQEEYDAKIKALREWATAEFRNASASAEVR